MLKLVVESLVKSAVDKNYIFKMLKLLQNKNFYKIIFLLIMPIIVYLAAHFLMKYNDVTICLWKNLFHVNCWGCGITRAFYALCHLDFNSAWNYNNKIYIIVPILVYIWIKEIIKAFKQY